MKRLLDVPVVLQPIDSVECGIASSKMIGDYYGLRRPYEEIKREMPVKEDWGLYIFEMGGYFLKHGFQAEIVSMNTNFLTLEHKGASTNEIREHVETLKKKKDYATLKEGLDTLTDFIDQGGKFTARIPTPHMIRQEINRKRPVLTTLTSRVLNKNLPWPNEHCAVIIGYDDHDFYLNDPEPRRGGMTQQFRQSDVMYAIYANTYPSVEGGSILKLKL